VPACRNVHASADSQLSNRSPSGRHRQQMGASAEVQAHRGVLCAEDAATPVCKQQHPSSQADLDPFTAKSIEHPNNHI